MKKSFKNNPVIFATPAILLGSIAMHQNDIPIMIWAQNIVCLMMLGIISCIVISRKSIKENRGLNITMIAMLMLLIMTLLGEGVDSVNRWVRLGPINFNVAFVSTPYFIIGLRKLLKEKKWIIAAFLTMVVSGILYLQPDASQITAFAIPMIIMLHDNQRKKASYLVTVGVLILMVTMSWIHIDELLPVSYVEEVLGLLKNLGAIWFILGLISLIILPIPFVLFPSKVDRKLSICIGIHIGILLVSTLAGNFPVPLMGYGITPIIGYFICITWYSKSKSIND